MRTVAWKAGTLRLIDQRKLPAKLEFTTISSHRAAARAIEDMVVRGAPAIGVTAAYGLALAAIESKARSLADLLEDLEAASRVLLAARPTAANLAWALNQLLSSARGFAGSADELRVWILRWAEEMADSDVEINRQMAVHGAALIHDGDTLIHHCNSGALAAVEWGTALGVIRRAHEQGKRVHVLVDETRPRLQGSRLTAWELDQYGIPYEIISDSMAGYFLSRGEVQEVMFGADRVAANGDVANKIGSYMLALAAHDNGVPVYVVSPTSSLDPGIATGEGIPIEERDPTEVLSLSVGGQPVAPKNARARNPAFDITPNKLITAIVTERGIARQPLGESLRCMLALDESGSRS